MKDLQRERLLELLADQTIFSLSEEELMELQDLQKQFPDWENDFSLELTATAINLSSLEINDELPASLRTKLFADAEEFFSRAEESQRTADSTQPVVASTVFPATTKSDTYVEAEPKRPFWQWLGWAVAAAACVALAVNLSLTNSQKPTEVVKNPETVQTPTPELTAAQKRAQLLAAAADAVQLPLTDPKNEKEVLGDVVWSNSLQQGFVRVRGLPPNNAAEETYQLWIVDGTQNPKTPISGGVFDVPAGTEVVVPIDAQLVVRQPKAIAVSKEKPGGVVVSAPERLVALAKV
jgi:anti-sigma-K factor RskA